MKLKRDLKFVLSAFALLALGGCATAPADPMGPQASPARKSVNDFEAANALLDAKRYEDAAKAFDKLRVENPATTLDYFVLLNGGIAYQSMNDCKTAAERYKTTI